MKAARYLIGIDEAGRGPIAGPVAVGAVCVATRKIPHWRRIIRGAKDVKQLRPAEREEWYGRILAWRATGLLNYTVSLAGHRLIDRRGIVRAIRLALRRCLYRLALPPAECLVLLDGGLSAPPSYFRQKTIIRGDETEPLIALASVVAKVRRDRHMIRLAPGYPAYGFERHKGYGTKAHYRAIRRHGRSAIHRLSFLH